MFDRIKKALLGDAKSADGVASQLPSQLQGPVSEWAASQGFSMSLQGAGDLMVVEGAVAGKPWRMEMGKPTRGYIRGEELRARAELGLSQDLAVVVMNRPLKESLEKRAYSMITDTLRTTADMSMPEEMRWLAMFEEYGWDSLPAEFWDRYSILADSRENALAWMDPGLARLLMEWPAPAPSREVPFIMVIVRGKGYLRMEYTPAEMTTLQHAAQVFTSACELAVGGFSTHVDL